MWFIELGAICVTVAVVVRVWWLVVQVLRARNKRRLLSRMFGVVSDSPDFIGISAICHDIDSVSQVADLLDVEYASYELLVVMDARLKPELFHEMLRHYRMMRVDYHPFEACSQLGVRGFYRSQTRDGVGGSSDPLYIVRADCRRTFAATLCPGVCRPVGSFRPGRRV